jgi:hypothetical protein
MTSKLAVRGLTTSSRQCGVARRIGNRIGHLINTVNVVRVKLDHHVTHVVSHQR